MPMSRLPSLVALRAFEAAARHLSFKKAAAELAVTPGAVSQHVRALECELGITLFDRAPRRISLTAAGRSLQPELALCFAMLRGAVDDILPDRISPLTISGAGMVLRNWLLPALHRFGAAHPDVPTHLKTLFSWNDLELGEDAVVLRLADVPPAGVYARRIHRVRLMPVVSPAFMARYNPACPEDFLSLPLLQDSVVQLFTGTPAWEAWFRHAGIGAPVPDYAMRFDPYSAEYAYDMAVAGKGVLLGWSIQCDHALRQGILVAPCAPALDLDLHYHVMCAADQAEKRHIRAFMDWAESEASRIDMAGRNRLVH